MNLRKFLTGSFLAHWKLIGVALLLAVIGIQQMRVVGLKSSLTAEKTGRAADRASYERAQAEATANALADKMKKDQDNARKADEADARADDLAVRYRSLSLQYAQAQRAASVQHLSSPAETTTRGNGPDRSPVLPLGQLMIPEADAFICATNQARLEAVRDWTLSLSAQKPQ